MEKWRCHSETQSLVYALLILIDLIVIIIDLIFLTTIWCGCYFYSHRIDRETEEQRLSKLLKVTLIFVYSSKQWTWVLETQVILLSFHQRNSTLELFSGVRNVSAFVSSKTVMIWENIWGKQHGSIGRLTVSFVCQMWLWSGEDCTTSVGQNFERVEPANGYILITRYPASQRIIHHCTGKTSSWLLHCAMCLYCTPKQPQRPQH